MKDEKTQMQQVNRAIKPGEPLPVPTPKPSPEIQKVAPSQPLSKPPASATPSQPKKT